MWTILGFLLSVNTLAGTCGLEPGTPDFLGQGTTQLAAARASSDACTDYSSKNTVKGFCVVAGCQESRSVWTCKTELILCE